MYVYMHMGVCLGVSAYTVIYGYRPISRDSQADMYRLSQTCISFLMLFDAQLLKIFSC